MQETSGQTPGSGPSGPGSSTSPAVSIPWGGRAAALAEAGGPGALSSAEQDDGKWWDLEVLQGPGSLLSALLWSQPPSSLGRQRSSLHQRTHRSPGPSRPGQAPATLGRQGQWGQGGDQSSPSRGGRQAQGFPGRQGQGNPLPASSSRQGQKAAAGGEGEPFRWEGGLEGKPGAQQTEAWPWAFDPRVRKGRCTDAPGARWSPSLLCRPGIR